MKQIFSTFLILQLVLFAFVSVKADEHSYVNLGLPSGTLWATCNIGAEKTESLGYYFQWGTSYKLTNEDDSFCRWKDYKWCNGSSDGITKYFDSVDELTALEESDDAATVIWGTEWSMPTKEQIDELLDSKYTYSKWTKKMVYKEDW